MRDLHPNQDIFKTVAAMDLCGTAKLIALAIRIHNTLDVAELVELTGESRRVVQLYRAQYLQMTDESCETRETGFAKDAKDAKPVSQVAKNVSRSDAPSPARVEDNNINTNLVDRPVSKQVSLVVAAPKPATGSRLAVGWRLPPDWHQWTRVTFPQSTDQTVTEQADTFADYWHACAGAKGRKADWEATWRNWCRRAFATAPVRPRSQPPPNGKPTLAAILAQREQQGALQ